MSENKDKYITIEVLALALGIALLPPIWAVLSPYIGVSTGSVSLICAAVYVANGNKIKDSVKIAFGFIMGLLWGGITLNVVNMFPHYKDLVLFTTLFILGGSAVIIANTIMSKVIYLPAWLCGWAIALQVLGSININAWEHTPLGIGISMIVGVFYVGVGVQRFQLILTKKLHKKHICSVDNNQLCTKFRY